MHHLFQKFLSVFALPEALLAALLLVWAEPQSLWLGLSCCVLAVVLRCWGYTRQQKNDEFGGLLFLWGLGYSCRVAWTFVVAIIVLAVLYGMRRMRTTGDASLQQGGGILPHWILYRRLEPHGKFLLPEGMVLLAELLLLIWPFLLLALRLYLLTRSQFVILSLLSLATVLVLCGFRFKDSLKNRGLRFPLFPPGGPSEKREHPVP